MHYYSPSDQQVSTTVSGETVILQYSSGEYYNLNEVGSFIWELLQQRPYSISDLTQQVCDNFEIDSSNCENDLKLLLHDLETNQLVSKTEKV